LCIGWRSLVSTDGKTLLVQGIGPRSARRRPRPPHSPFQSNRPYSAFLPREVPAAAVIADAALLPAREDDIGRHPVAAVGDPDEAITSGARLCGDRPL
jgi:hypothetical protein